MFWRSVGLLKEGQLSEAQRDFGSLRTKRDTSVAATAALLHIASSVGQGAIHSPQALNPSDSDARALEGQLKAEAERAGVRQLALAAHFLLSVSEFQRARDLANAVPTPPPPPELMRLVFEEHRHVSGRKRRRGRQRRGRRRDPLRPRRQGVGGPPLRPRRPRAQSRRLF
jgi:hypothetical protein